METSPHSRRAAATALILEEVDDLLARVESLPAKLGAADATLAASVATLEAAGDRYRMAITAFTDEAKTELTEYLQRKTFEESARCLEQFRAALDASARVIVSHETAAAAKKICMAVDDAAAQFKKSRHIRMIEIAVIVLVSSSTTCVLWYVLNRLG